RRLRPDPAPLRPGRAGPGRRGRALRRAMASFAGGGREVRARRSSRGGAHILVGASGGPAPDVVPRQPGRAAPPARGGAGAVRGTGAAVHIAIPRPSVASPRRGRARCAAPNLGPPGRTLRPRGDRGPRPSHPRLPVAPPRAAAALRALSGEGDAGGLALLGP